VHSHIRRHFRHSTARIHREYQIIRLRRMLKSIPAVADAEAYSAHLGFLNEDQDQDQDWMPLTAIVTAVASAVGVAKGI
jgi:hypothetical protein